MAVQIVPCLTCLFPTAFTDFPPFGETAAGSGSSSSGGGGGTDQGSPSSLRVALLDGEPLPLTERFLLLCSRPMHELAYLLKTALAAYQAAKAEGGWGGVGGPGGGHTPMKKVRPYRIAASASSILGALPASSSTSAGAAGLASADGGGAGGGSSSTNSALFSPGSASLRKIKPKVISQPQQGPAGAGSVPGALSGGGGGLQVSSSCGGSSSGSGSGSLTGLLSRLEAAFFQQHPHLHRCTELALQATLKNGLALARDRCVAPAVQAAVGRLLQQGCVPAASCVTVDHLRPSSDHTIPHHTYSHTHPQVLPPTPVP